MWCCNLLFPYSHVMVYILNSENYCYLLSSVVLLDVSMTSFAFVYSELKQRLTAVRCRLKQSTVDTAVDQWCRRLRACVRAKRGHFEHSLLTYWLRWFCQCCHLGCCVLFKCCIAEWNNGVVAFIFILVFRSIFRVLALFKQEKFLNMYVKYPLHLNIVLNVTLWKWNISYYFYNAHYLLHQAWCEA